MKIMKLEPSAHRQGRWLVWFEDGSLLRVGEGDVVSLGLYAGKELSPEEAERLSDAAGQGRVNARAVELLSRRPMSRRELVDKLSAPPRKRGRPGQGGDEMPREADPEALAQQREALRERAERAADRMADLGLLNDEEYAAAVVRHYSAKGYGERRLRDELYRRGVPREYWEGALSQREEAEGGEDGGSAIDRLLAQKLRGQELTRESLKRACDYRARRGFGWEELSAAIERARRQREAEE